MLLQNAFSEKLYRFGFDLFVMLVVDMLHEFELGVWKSVFMHLLRMLECLEESKIHELDRRYVLCPDVFYVNHSCLHLDIAKSRHLGGIPFGVFLETHRK